MVESIRVAGRHARESGQPVRPPDRFGEVDSRLRGNDGAGHHPA
jgi:hypothetical protein